MELTKRCSQCNQLLSVSTFSKDKRSSDNLRSECKKCDAIYRYNHQKEIKQYEKSRREKKNIYHQHWRANNKQWIHKYNEKNRAKRRVNDAKYRDVHQEQRSNYNQIWYLENPAYYRNYNRKWRSTHPEQRQAQRAKRRAVKMKNTEHFTGAEWKLLKKQYQNRCLRCDLTEPEIKLTPDHIIPLSRGGTDKINNIQPLCRSCNSKKGVRIIDYRSK